MKTITMLDFRQNAQSVLRRIAKGERFFLSHRGKRAARFGATTTTRNDAVSNDPFLTIGSRATASPKGKTKTHRYRSHCLWRQLKYSWIPQVSSPCGTRAMDIMQPHSGFSRSLVRKRRHFLTTEYVADETITLLLAAPQSSSGYGLS